MLTTEEAARRLGVKVPTLYAYVSRGLLESQRDPATRGSLFDLGEVETLAARRREGRTTTRLATVTTAVTRLHQERGPIYRGHAATELAACSPFEDVAEWLWQSRERGDWSAPELGTCPLATTMDRMRWALVMCGATDPLRSDRRPESVARAARRMAAALVDVVGEPAAAPAQGDEPTPARSLASRLAGRLGADASVPVPTAAVNAALVLMADHELAASTMAVRVAAVGPRRPLRRAACRPGHARRAATRGGQPAGVRAPGHGRARRRRTRPSTMSCVSAAACPVSVTPSTRAATRAYGALMELAEPLLDEDRRALVREVVSLAEAHDVPAPNCDLALAALSWGTGMPPDTGRTLFAVSRVAGWTAHYLEELAERPLRFRARAVYASA